MVKTPLLSQKKPPEFNQGGPAKTNRTNRQSFPLLALQIAGIEVSLWEGAGQGRVNKLFVMERH